MMSRSALVLLFGILSGVSLSSSGANAQETCATPGTVAFSDMADTRTAIAPSVHRQLSGLGRLAVAGGCEVVITCPVASGAGTDGKRVRDRQCSATRSAMGMFERRTNVRSDILKGFVMEKVTENSQWAAGKVYVTLK